MLIKSIFISSFITALSLGVGYALWMLSSDGGAMAWWAVLLALVPILGFFIRLFLSPIARTASLMKFPLLAAVAAALVLAVAMGLPTMATALPWAMVLILGIGGNLAYQLWYSRFGREKSAALAVGKNLPAIELENTQGEAVQLRDMDGALLLMFYRGNWCPLCMAQIREVAASYQALAQRGVKIVLISSQSHDNSADLAKKFNVPFHFLVDKGNRVAEQLGILARMGTPMGLQALGYTSDTVMPTVVITDAKKQVIFCDETDNYRIRPEPETFLRILDQYQSA